MNIEKERSSSFNIVLDNIDLKVLASDIISDNQNEDYHWCNHNAHLDRVNPVHLENNVPTANLEALPNSVFVPSLDDQNIFSCQILFFLWKGLLWRVCLHFPCSKMSFLFTLNISTFRNKRKKKTETLRDWLNKAIHSNIVYLDLTEL